MTRAAASKETVQKAVIYSRVSTKKQSAEGSGLESQEHRCRQYAEARGYEVEAVFPDDVSGAGDFMKRPGMVALLAYLEARSETDFVIIFDDLKRFSRDIEFHKKLRRTLEVHGARPECLNFRFEDTPEGKFLETLVAAQGELERDQNRRQVIQKMSARIEQGYAIISRPPAGYRYEKSREHSKILVRDEPVASIVQEALESYASGRFQTQAEVKRFLDAQPDFPKSRSGAVTFERVKEILVQPLYAGYVEAPY
ncbi:MAG: recombinase family protein, partial [Pseudomonadota bacterium]